MSVAGVSGGGCRGSGASRGRRLHPRPGGRESGWCSDLADVWCRTQWDDRGLAEVAEEAPSPALGDVNMIVGTSAGSVLAAALRCGLTLDELTALQRGEPMPALRGAGLRDLDDRALLPPRPHLHGPAHPRLILTTLRAPHTIHPSVWASAWLPQQARGPARPPWPPAGTASTAGPVPGPTAGPGSWRWTSARDGG